MAAAIIIIPTRWCAGAIAWCRWMCMCPAARPRRRRWCTGSCSCRRRSGGREPSFVADRDMSPERAEALLQAAETLPGVKRAAVEQQEVVLHAERDQLLPLMTTLRDDPRFAFEQLMDLCGVDW